MGVCLGMEFSISLVLVAVYSACGRKGKERIAISCDVKIPEPESVYLDGLGGVEEHLVGRVAAMLVLRLAAILAHVLEGDVADEQVTAAQQAVLGVGARGRRAQHQLLIARPVPGDHRTRRADGAAMDDPVGANVLQRGVRPEVDAGGRTWTRVGREGKAHRRLDSIQAYHHKRHSQADSSMENICKLSHSFPCTDPSGCSILVAKRHVQ